MPVQLAKRQSTKTVSRYPTSMAMAKKVLNPIKTVHTPLPQRGNARTVKMSEKKKKRKSANLEVGCLIKKVWMSVSVAYVAMRKQGSTKRPNSREPIRVVRVGLEAVLIMRE